VDAISGTISVCKGGVVMPRRKIEQTEKKQERKLTKEEREYLETLIQLKDEMIERVLYKSDYINRQIADVKSGKWLERVKNNECPKEEKEC
jgi:ribonuclease HII